MRGLQSARADWPQAAVAEVVVLAADGRQVDGVATADGAVSKVKG